MKKIEILAPAGSFDSVIAAVRSGADAVYLGEKAFSARSSAKNFDDEELKKATAYCHIHGVKVYVTINTIVNARLSQVANRFTEIQGVITLYQALGGGRM